MENLKGIEILTGIIHSGIRDRSSTMENVEISEHLVALFDQIKVAKTLVDDGKEVACSRQLQGAKTRCLHLMQELKEKTENVMVEEVERKPQPEPQSP